MLARAIRIQRIDPTGQFYEDVLLDAAANALKNISTNASGDLVFTTDQTGSAPVIDYGKTLFVNSLNPAATDTRTGLDKNDLTKPFATLAAAYAACAADESIVIHACPDGSLTHTKNIAGFILDEMQDNGFALTLDNSLTVPEISITGRQFKNGGMSLNLPTASITSSYITVDLQGRGSVMLTGGHAGFAGQIKIRTGHLANITSPVVAGVSAVFEIESRVVQFGNNTYNGMWLVKAIDTIQFDGATFSQAASVFKTATASFVDPNPTALGGASLYADVISGGVYLVSGNIYADLADDLGNSTDPYASGTARIRTVTGTVYLQNTVLFSDSVSTVVANGGSATVRGATISALGGVAEDGTESFIFIDCEIPGGINVVEKWGAIRCKNCKITGYTNQGAIHVTMDDANSGEWPDIILDGCILIPNGTAATAITITPPATPASYSITGHVIKTTNCRLTKELLPSQVFASSAVLTDKINSPGNQIDPDFATSF